MPDSQELKNIRNDGNVDKSVLKSAIFKKVLGTISDFKMLEEKDSVLISLSGGPDSIFLTLFFHMIKESYGLKLFCFHLDHKTRNGESTRNADFVSSFCRELDIKLFRKEIDAKGWAREKKLSFQEGARLLRMEMLKELSRENNIKKIAVGHTANDNIETFFLNLLRGAGARGLAGIKPVNGKFIRPLIRTQKKDIQQFLEEKQIPFCVDKTNLQQLYLRNKIRNLLIPFIKKNFSAGLEEKITRTLEILRQENDFLENYTLLEWQGLIPAGKKITGVANSRKGSISSQNTAGEKQIVFPLKELKTLPAAIRSRLILKAIETIKGSSRDVKAVNIRDIARIFSGNDGEMKRWEAAGGVDIIREGENLYFKKSIKKAAGKTGRKTLEKAGGKIKKSLEGKKITPVIMVPGAGLELNEAKIKISSEVFAAGLDFIKSKRIKGTEVFLDYEKIKFPILVKSWEKEGEKFIPLGMQTLKKLQDFFIDQKITSSIRGLVPIFYDKEKIIWVGGYRPDERVKLDQHTRKILHIKIIPF